MLGAFTFTLYGNDLQDSMFEFVSAIGTVGLGIGITGFEATNLILLSATIGMF